MSCPPSPFRVRGPDFYKCPPSINRQVICRCFPNVVYSHCPDDLDLPLPVDHWQHVAMSGKGSRPSQNPYLLQRLTDRAQSSSEHCLVEDDCHLCPPVMQRLDMMCALFHLKLLQLSARRGDVFSAPITLQRRSVSGSCSSIQV